MNLYKVEARASYGEYVEHVTVISDVTEKPKSYTTSVSRINKDKINNVYTGLFKDSFETYVLSEEDIPKAREELKKAVGQQVKEAWEKAKENMEDFENHTFEREVKRTYK